MRSRLIIGLAGTTLQAAEQSFLRDSRPVGLILFARNCSTKPQVRRLVEDARSAIGEEQTLVLIDQEGGRVRRLKPPEWRELPPAGTFARLHASDPDMAVARARLVARLTADELREIGINTNCAPVLDLAYAGAHQIIGDRAYGAKPAAVAALGRAVAEGLIAGGVLPVIKHIPGHGRARADSHVELPAVEAPLAELEATDFAPFRALRDMPAAMSAHVVYSAIDPDRPASTSARVTGDIIRDRIGFDGLLMSDDICMGALSGSVCARAGAVIAAGSDIALHCNGNLNEAESAAAEVPTLAGRPLQRALGAFAALERAQPFDTGEAVAALGEMLRPLA
jgi:beta-N-acetylhexosaminidase